MSYIVLSYRKCEVLLPVGSFEAWEQENGKAAISSITDADKCFICDQDFKTVMEMLSKVTTLAYDR